MATLLKVNKMEDKEEGKVSFTPEQILGELFYFHNVAHKYHLDTKSFAIHKATDELYKGLVDFKDNIAELLMGYMGGKRIGKIKIDDIPEYSDSNVIKLAKDLEKFAHELYEWAGEKEYCDIENTAQALSGLAASTIYKLTLS